MCLNLEWDETDWILNHSRVVYDGTNPPKPRPQRQWPPGINGEACELLFGGLTKLKERVMGDRKHLCMSFIFCAFQPLLTFYEKAT